MANPAGGLGGCGVRNSDKPKCGRQATYREPCSPVGGCESAELRSTKRVCLSRERKTTWGEQAKKKAYRLPIRR